jgi:hypothetical protein
MERPMSWEPAEKVQKNEAGEYRAFIGGQWIPVQKAQKSESGEYRVERFQREPMEEPEFEKEAKRIVAGTTTLGGVAAETGKGLLRGASNVGETIMRGSTKALLGPVWGNLAAEGYMSLAAPSRKLIEASPMSPAEAAVGAASEVGGEFLAPSLPAAALKAGQVAAKAVSPVARTVRNFVDPMLPGGTERAVGRTLLELAGKKRARVMAALGEPATIVPGSVPTAAEAAAKAGSAEFSGAQKVLEKGSPTRYSDIAAGQEGARQGAIQGFGKTPQQLEKAIADRKTEAKDLYEKAAKQVLIVDDELRTLLARPSMQKHALPRAKELSDEFQLPFKIGKDAPAQQVPSRILGASGEPATITNIPATSSAFPVRSLHTIKMAMDDLISTPERFGIGGAEVKAISGTRKELLNWLTQRSSDYEKARAAYAAASKPINVMQVGQQLEKSLVSPLAATERAGPFATALQEAPRTIKKATGSPRFTSLEEAVGKENAASAQAVLAELSRVAQHEKLATAGASKASEIIQGAVPQVPPSGMFSPIYSVFRTVFNRFGGKLNDNERKVLSEVLETPQATLKLMEAAARREALAQSFQAQKLQSMSRAERLRAGGAGVAAGQLQE